MPDNQTGALSGIHSSHNLVCLCPRWLEVTVKLRQRHAVITKWFVRWHLPGADFDQNQIERQIPSRYFIRSSCTNTWQVQTPGEPPLLPAPFSERRVREDNLQLSLTICEIPHNTNQIGSTA